MQGEREDDEHVPDGGEDPLLLGERLLHGGLAAVGPGQGRLPLRPVAHVAARDVVASGGVIGGVRGGRRVARVAVVVIMVVSMSVITAAAAAK